MKLFDLLSLGHDYAYHWDSFPKEKGSILLVESTATGTRILDKTKNLSAISVIKSKCLDTAETHLYNECWYV